MGGRGEEKRRDLKNNTWGKEIAQAFEKAKLTQQRQTHNPEIQLSKESFGHVNLGKVKNLWNKF